MCVIWQLIFSLSKQILQYFSSAKFLYFESSATVNQQPGLIFPNRGPTGYVKVVQSLILVVAVWTAGPNHSTRNALCCIT